VKTVDKTIWDVPCVLQHKRTVAQCSQTQGTSHIVCYGEAPYDVRFEARPAGADIFASVTGGTRPHIGAVALAEPADASHPVTEEPVKRTSGKVSVLTAEGHKDAVIAEMFAKKLCEKYGVNVCVSAGVHVDDASKEEIALLLDNLKALLKLI